MSVYRVVGKSALAQILVSGISGLVGILTARLIFSHYGDAAYAQYGLIATLPSLLPFADLGMAAVIVNNTAASHDPANDLQVRRTITSALRIMIASGATIALISVAVLLLGLWPRILGSALLPGAEVAVTACLVIFGLGLPLGVGARLLVALGRNPLQTALQGLNAPTVVTGVWLLTLLGATSVNFLAVPAYAATAVVSATALIAASRIIRPQVRLAVADVARRKAAPGVPVMHLAWPMLVQMTALPVAMQTGRVLLSHRGTSQQLASYNLAAQLFNMIGLAVATAGVALWPHYAKGRVAGERQSPIAATRVFIAGGLALSLVLWAILPLVVDLASDGKAEVGVTLAAAFVVFVTVQAAKYPVGMYMTGPDGLRFQVLPILLMVPLNVGLTWFLIPLLGATGPVVATTASVLICQVVPNSLWVRRDLRRHREAAEYVAG